MIVIDTSALIAIVQGEPDATRCRAAIAGTRDIFIAAPTLTEALIVAGHRHLGDEMARLIDDLALIIVPFTESHAYSANRAYSAWGKGYHKAKLNLGDTFAYALAKALACPLLCIGGDFTETDIASALA